MLKRLSVDDVPLLSKLNDKHQQILLATTAIEKPTYQNLSWHLGIPIGTVKSRLSRAKVALANVKSVNNTPNLEL